MATWRITSKLNEMELSEVEELRDRALEYLSANYLDALGCIRYLEIEDQLYYELVHKYLEEFALVENRFILEVERTMVMAALGLEEVDSARITLIKWVLERRNKKYRRVTNVKFEEPPPALPNGKGAMLLNEHEGRRAAIGRPGRLPTPGED